jgi:hypothetical protein
MVISNCKSRVGARGARRWACCRSISVVCAVKCCRATDTSFSVSVNYVCFLNVVVSQGHPGHPMSQHSGAPPQMQGQPGMHQMNPPPPHNPGPPQQSYYQHHPNGPTSAPHQAGPPAGYGQPMQQRPPGPPTTQPGQQQAPPYQQAPTQAPPQRPVSCGTRDQKRQY